jgi:POT family proton-dependent oligopeptide transporter
MTFFTDELINRNVGGFTVPTAWFQSINPLLIVGLAPIFATLWTTLGARNTEPNVPQKMALGIILAGAGFLFMYGAVLDLGSAFSGLTGDAATAAAKQMSDSQKAGIWWVTMAYVMHTLGELCLSPVGLSMVTKLAPARLQSMLMGVWFFSVFLANILAGLLVGVSQEFGYESFFLGLSVVIIGLGLVLLLLSPRIKKMMHGVE